MAVTAPATPVHAAPAARALVTLQARELLAFLETWREARTAGLALPAVEDRDYASLHTLLRHVLGASRHYVTWCCQQVDLPVPTIPAPPAGEDLDDGALDAWVAGLLEAWSTALVDLSEEALDRPEHPSAWGTAYCLDAMLEHAVMHPIRHRYQLRGLLDG